MGGIITETKCKVEVDERGFIHLKIEKNEHITGYVGNIAGWLEVDVQSSGRRYLSKIKKILKSSTPFNEEIFSGNAYEACIRRDYTTISYDFEEEWPEMVPCTLPTQTLCEILELWINVCDEHS